MGLIQREIERIGIATIGISIVRQYSEQVQPPRTVFLQTPFGLPLGEAGNIEQQRTIVMAALDALYQIKIPGTIIDLPFVVQPRKITPLKRLHTLSGTEPKKP